MVQLATRVDDASGEMFKSITKRLGTTPADAMRMFVMAFNANQGFPYDVRLSSSSRALPHGRSRHSISLTILPQK